MPPQQEQGDDYVRRLATFIRDNERGLAETAAAIRRRRRPREQSTSSMFNPLSWTAASSTPPKPVILSIDTHHLFYIFMRMEAVGLDVGTLDVQIESPSRPLSYIEVLHGSDNSDTISLASFASSLSAISSLSLGTGWFSRAQPLSVDAELAFIFSSFTKLPALCITAPGKIVVAELANEPPNTNAIPLDVFRNLQYLDCCDVDPRALLGWDRLSDSLRTLKIRKSGIEDVTDVFIGTVLDDAARKAGSSSRQRRRRIQRTHSITNFTIPQVPETVPEDGPIDEEEPTPALEHPNSPLPSSELPQYKWSLLKHLFLSDNALTFLPSSPLFYLSSLTHLDLSSNLLVSVPPGLSALYSLISLNLSDNMIDSVLGIYTNLGQVLHLNVSCNRLESICGLERLKALESVDLRGNHIDEVAEISRLATLPNISQVWVEGNPFTEIEESYRVTCFNYFWKESKSITLDGSSPGLYEKSRLTPRSAEQMSSSRPVSIANSPPTVAVGHSHQQHHHQHPSSRNSPASQAADSGQEGIDSAGMSPLGVGLGKPKKKKVKRIVDLDQNNAVEASPSGSLKHIRMRSDGSKIKQRPKKEIEPPGTATSEPAPEPTPPPDGSSLLPSVEIVTQDAIIKPRTSRYQTDVHLPASPLATPSSPAVTSYGPGSMRDARKSMNLPSRSAARQKRVSASMFESPGGGDIIDGSDTRQTDGEAFRKKIEELKREMGDGWLKVYSETQMERA